MTQAKCRAMLSNPESRFNQIWSAGGWTVRHHGEPACWGTDGPGFFEHAWLGSWCNRNWYIGNKGSLGQFGGGPAQPWVWPRFTHAAPALLGFDESIDWFCATHGGFGDHSEASVSANLNILSIQDGTYNTCKNLEWQVCAARGYLPGQMSRDIQFAFRPAELRSGLIGACTGYSPAGCGDQGYASYDIFFLEICMFSEFCSNGAELFQLNVGDFWHCELDEAGFSRLRDWVLQGTGSPHRA